MKAKTKAKIIPVKKEELSKKMGRPSTYSHATASEICQITATSNKSLATICREMNCSARTVLGWLQDNLDFAQNYARAKDNQADFLAEEIIEIADDSSQDLERVDDFGNRIENKEFVNRSKLRVDARKWIAAKLKPRKYSEKMDVTTNGESINKPNYDNLSVDELNILLKLQKKASGGE